MEEKRICRKKKRQSENRMIQESCNINNVRKFCQIINEDRKTFKPKITINKNELGNILTRKEAILQQ